MYLGKKGGKYWAPRNQHSPATGTVCDADCENGAWAHTLRPDMERCHSQMSVLNNSWGDGTENRSYSQEPLSPGLSSVYLSLIWWRHLGLPHFTAALIVRSRIAGGTSLLLNLAARWILNSQEYLCQNFGPGVRNIVFLLQPGEVWAEKWKWMETNQQGI